MDCFSLGGCLHLKVVDELGEADVENQLSQTFAHAVSPTRRKWNKGALQDRFHLGVWVKSTEIEVLRSVEELVVEVDSMEHHLEAGLLVEHKVSNSTLLDEGSQETDPSSSLNSEHFPGEIKELLAAVVVFVV